MDLVPLRDYLDKGKEANSYRKLLNEAASLLNEAENRISELLFFLKQAKGFLPYDKNALYQQINEIVEFSSVEESLPILRDRIDSTLESFEIEGISVGTWEESDATDQNKQK